MLAYPEYVIHSYEPTPVFAGTPKAATGTLASQPSRAHS